MTSEALPDGDLGAAVLLVRCGDRRFGLPLMNVERVLPMAFISSLPGTNGGLMGMLNVHGEVVPVIDPHPRLGVASPKVAAEHRLVLLRATARFLVWVDEVEEVVSVQPTDMSAVPAPQASPVVGRVMRLGDALVPMLAAATLEPSGILQ